MLFWHKMRNNLPTDRRVLRAIYNEYESVYPGNNYEDGVKGPNDPLLEIDLPRIAQKLGIRPELLHGILYFHLNEVYGYESRQNIYIQIFEKVADNKSNCINFPYLASKLAALDEEFEKMLITRVLSIFAIIISVFALSLKIFS